MLLAVRAITYLCDAMPRAADAVVRHGLLPVLCSRLLAIEYLDVAEQCLQAFEKISRRKPTQCLQAGMITAVLAYIDFFASSIQRVAVSAVANVCKKIPTECSQFVIDSVPMLCNLLQSEDKMVVEKVATCLISIVDSFSGSVELLDQLCHQGVVEKVLPLINTSGITSLSPSTCSNLIGLLAKLACTSLVAVKSLFELNVGSTIRGILVSSDLSHGMPYLPSENQNNQVNEALKLAIQLIPSVARDVEDTHMVLAKEKIIVDEPRFLCQFSRDILPVLIKAVNSGANSYICYGCSSVVNNICYFSKPEMLQDLLKETNISSFLAGLLSRKDHHVLISSLKIIEILMQKLPDAYLGSFIKEGVVYAVEALLMQDDCSKSSPSDGTEQSENQPAIRSKPTCFCYAFDSRRSESAETRTCRIGQGNLFNFARHVKTTYFTAEAVSSEMGLTEILQKLKTCCAVLNDSADKSLNQDGLQNEEHLSNILSEVMMELHGGETMTTFEFLESGLVKSLLNYLSNGIYLQVDDNLKDNNADHFYAVLKRFQSFAHICFSRMEQGWGDMLLTLLVRKLQSALTSIDNFPVIMSHNFKPRNNISDIPIRHSTITPCIRVRFKKDEDETNLSSYDNAVNLEISSSLNSIEQFLWPKVSTSTSDQDTESSPSSVASESKYTEDDPQERDSSPDSSPPSEGITRENQNSPVEPCAKKVSSSSAGGQPERNKVIGTDRAVQPKLAFSLKGKELDRSVTLYQSILQDQINVGADVVLDTQFWYSVHDVTFRMAANPERDDCPDSSNAPISTNDSKTGLMWQALPSFSSLLLGKISCKIDKSSPSYDILFMLKVLEGLNRFSFHLVSNERNHAFAQGRITNLDDLKPSVSSVPLQEFVSAKLTDKLEQQMHDPLVSRSRCLPLWCTELMSTCPFLFSFEARWKYFQLTAFGSSSIQHGHMRDTSGNNIATERSPSFSRKKFKVDRNDILVSAAKVMRSYARSNALLEVEYEEEVGTGLGPTMEFYTLISHEFQKSGLGMWRGELPCEARTDKTHIGPRTVVAPNGLFPRPWSASVELPSEVKNRFHLLGLVLAKAIKDGRILDIPFSKAFYKLILGQELNIYDINSFDPELATTLMEFKALTCQRKYLESCSTKECQSPSDLSYRGCTIEDLAIDFTVPGYPEYVLSLESSSDNVTAENLEEYVSFVVEATVKNGISRQLEAFKSGFSQVFPLSTLQVFSEDELERLLCGEQDNWDFVKLVDHIKFDHGYTSSSPAVINLLEIIQEFGCHERRAFLQFITGSPRLPPGGLAALNPNLTVVRKHSNNDAEDDLPSVMTCANYLKLPAYCSKERMREKLLYAITEGQGSFHLS
ncbi:E3 ubiquitin-protein ligase UPL4-like [Lolium rigidum]|uniref:E3 ubiquitin-protein ligase UPL4-like n=1 Tax=Lolium rigidum TaxID=89674 RepID=UPI001F5CD3DD|nr:E3 ubiquitin-protein ligase UPL4-like [Lolium rigidum]